jgi:acetyl-CoA acetyltransferase family protein
MHARYGTDAMGTTAENLAEIYNINRDDQDLFAFRSQQKATAARARGRFEKEIIPVQIPQPKGQQIIFGTDEFIKPGTTREVLSQLKPAFKKESGSVTAGNSSGLNDGAAALVVASGKFVNANGLKPLARIVASAVTGVEPRIMGIGPVSASQKALEKAGLDLKEMDIIEINEAFAAQVLACTRLLGISDDDERINPNGGAIALGHPLGMSGARLLQTVAVELQEQNRRFALVTMCVGVGQGYAVILEKA